jgi:hypothetical protein
MKDIIHNCVNCKFFGFNRGDSTQPYDEYYCMKGHWDGIASQEDLDALNKQNDCKDFNIK